MNVTRAVINDLLPIYLSGEASADTRALVEDFFRRDPDFERMARSASATLDTLKGASRPGLLSQSEEAEKEKRDLECVRGALLRKKIFFGLALFFSLAPLAFVFKGGHIVWMMVRNAPWDAAVYWSLAAVMWFFYFAKLSRRRFSLVVAIFFTLFPMLDILHDSLVRSSNPGSNSHSDLLWETTLFWGMAAPVWLRYFARLRLRTLALLFAIFLTLIPFPFLLYPMLAGGPRVFSTTAEPMIVWCIAAVVWVRYFYLRDRHESDGRC
ncbi:MAG TPA: hypothetical protein VJN21_12560 [Candidatus Acidoferrales bacterium]|nr:hypothetical protein [Candidatus Acidoferrales bacterium]